MREILINPEPVGELMSIRKLDSKQHFRFPRVLSSLGVALVAWH